MNNISMNQALSIWDDLWQAYYGKNGYGGDTAEIYAYRLMNFEPTLLLGGSNAEFRETGTYKTSSRVAYAKAANSLANLLIKFESDMDCKITVNDKPVRDWVETEVFDHRCHVKVIKNES